MTDQKFTVFQSLAQALADHEVKTIFGLLGDANLFFVDHAVREHGAEFVPFAHEGGSVLAAMAHARVTGRVSVATVTHGPALTNCLTALVEGVRARDPIVLMAGDTPVVARHNPQSIDQREIAKLAGAGFVQIRTVETVAEDVAIAFYKAATEKRPVVLNMPAEFMWVETTHRRVVHPVFAAPAMVPEGDDFDQAIGMIASARGPIVLAGGGAKGAEADVIALAERMQAPLATTLQAKEMFRGHPANIGIFGTLSTPVAYDVIAKSDCVVVLGASLHIFTTDAGKLLKGKRVVQVDTSPAAIGDMFHPDVALIADARLTARNIIHWLDEAEIAPSGFAAELNPATSTQHPAGKVEACREGYVDFAYALDRLEEILPQDRVLTFDGGRFMTEVWCRVSATDPRHFVYGTRFGSIGLGLQMSIGTAMATRGRPSVLFTGDGGFMAGGLTEFNTAVRQKLDLIIVVCNDSAYGAEHIQMTDRNMDPKISWFDWPSFAEAAKALGGDGVEVSSPADLDGLAARIEARERDRPFLIDLKLHPDDVPRMRL